MTGIPALVDATPAEGAPAAAVPGGVLPGNVPDAAWTPVCALADLAVERGAAALVDGEQVALFRLLDDTVHAVQQHEPHTQAMVMSRGIVGTRGGRPVVTSPLYKQVFDLLTGECLDTTKGERTPLVTWPVEVRDGVVHVGSSGAPGARTAA
ncbi:assimilatory nitrite reductase (NAD(P)H) small subunit [Flavimobilis soli]|uniref:Assimilatory nitrite reductase (NAD(P)H) small subunit n=1 Tax=Flavimobilis soli TaxID=442709 RepID=A0A2A9EEA9_9MICO|nr:nitrite reductase small subunit NirD [Flavimobilis soli]PFG37143.1 assimilatory nitrite reductase (NAD(P)H) small subunit [Flavimobilis soli]